MNILGIETSCDETSAAVLTDGTVRSNVISSQLVHRAYGGVVPELASRAHQQLIVPVVEEALRASDVPMDRLDAVAVTYGPGLMGALLVGLNFSKAFAYGLGIPLVGVNHMEGHIYSNFLEDPRPQYPFVCLIVSGGHTQLVLIRAPLEHELLGETLDDAAGEAYDKVAKMLGLGFPGGPAVDRLAQGGNPGFLNLPRSFLGRESLEFSFSGVKTAVLYWLRDHGYRTRREGADRNGANGTGDGHLLPEDIRAHLPDICASFQNAVVDVLVEKLLRAVRATGVAHVAIAGGVSANSELRRRAASSAHAEGFRLYIPALKYCTDNAAMIAAVGTLRFTRGMTSGFDLNAIPNLSL
jgi:N6-L-threonylcarbamoyladenine synthase